MKSKITYIALLISCCFACNDSFLEVAPTATRSVAGFYKNPNDFNNAVIGAYSILKRPGIYGGSLIWMGEVMSDNTTFTKPRVGGNIDQYAFVDHEFSLLNEIIYNAWRDHYEGIAATNIILEKIGNVDFGANDKKDQYIAEAKFLRALYYFDLVRMFGDVPLVTSEITSPFAGLEFIRNPAEEIYALIVDDLTAAEQSLPVSYLPDDAGRATRGAAKALLGKVYLTMGLYAKAEIKLKETIDLNQYKLLDDYGDVFNVNNPNNAEIIFAVQYISGEVGQGNGFWDQFAPSDSYEYVLGPGVSSGGGMNIPTPDMVEAYEPLDKRKSASLEEGYMNTSDDVFVNDPYVIKYKDYGKRAGDGGADFPVLRYADVLLMYAEALNEQQRSGEALPYLNEVRHRAGLEDLTISDQSGLKLAIELERRVELAFENQRWFDLVRTGRYVEVMNSKGYQQVKDYHRFFLIPQHEIDLNPKLVQNQGY